MTEALRLESRFSTDLGGIGTDLQASVESIRPIQLIWIRPVETDTATVEDGAVDTRGTYTEFVKMPPPGPRPESNPDASWDGINRMSRVQESCRRTANFIGGNRIP